MLLPRLSIVNSQNLKKINRKNKKNICFTQNIAFACESATDKQYEGEW